MDEFCKPEAYKSVNSNSVQIKIDKKRNDNRKENKERKEIDKEIEKFEKKIESISLNN